MSRLLQRVYRNYPIIFPNKVTYVKLVELDMFDFDVILVRMVACFLCLYRYLNKGGEV